MNKIIHFLSCFLLCSSYFFSSPSYADDIFSDLPISTRISIAESDVLLSEAYATRIAELGAEAKTKGDFLRLARIGSLDLGGHGFIYFDIELKKAAEDWADYGVLVAAISVDASGAGVVDDFFFAPLPSSSIQGLRDAPARSKMTWIPFEVSLMLVRKDFTDLAAEIAATKTEPGRLNIAYLRADSLSGHPFGFVGLQAIQATGSEYTAVPLGDIVAAVVGHHDVVSLYFKPWPGSGYCRNPAGPARGSRVWPARRQPPGQNHLAVNTACPGFDTVNSSPPSR